MTTIMTLVQFSVLFLASLGGLLLGAGNHTILGIVLVGVAGLATTLLTEFWCGTLLIAVGLSKGMTAEEVTEIVARNLELTGD